MFYASLRGFEESYAVAITSELKFVGDYDKTVIELQISDGSGVFRTIKEMNSHKGGTVEDAIQYAYRRFFQTIILSGKLWRVTEGLQDPMG
jgi:hypothetical protein